MDEGFDLPVEHNGKEYLFASQLLRLGYIYRIQVEVEDTTVQFERDEERAWRVLADPAEMERKTIDPSLLRAIAESIDKVLS